MDNINAPTRNASGIEECWDDLELQNKIGVAIVGMVAVAKMTGLSSKGLQNPNVMLSS